MNVNNPHDTVTRKALSKNLKRKDYVEKTSEIIEKEGVKACSIRRISKELGCSSTALYRHFKNLDELLFYAQLSNLNTYITNLKCNFSRWKSTWQMHFGIWELYAYQAFYNPEAVDLVFYRNINQDLGSALTEYYEMFPEAMVHVPPTLVQMLQIPGFYERDYSILQKIVDEGSLSVEIAQKINHIECTLFLGYFKNVMDLNISEAEIPAIVQKFIGEIRDVISMYLGYDPLMK